MIAWAAGTAAAGVYLLDNFTEAKHTGVQGSARVYVERKEAKSGRGCLGIEYDISNSNLTVSFDTRGRTTGKVTFWVKGDGSSSVLRLVWRHFHYDDKGSFRDAGGEFAADVKLDFIDWKMVTASPPVNADASAMVRFVNLSITKPAEAKQTAGRVFIDEMMVDSPRLTRTGDAVLSVPRRLAGPGSKAIFYLDVRNHTKSERASCMLSAKLTDAKGNAISNIRLRWEAAPGSSEEKRLVFDAKLQDFIPPFQISCQFISAALNCDISVNRSLPMPSHRDVFADFSVVADLWRGGEAMLEEYLERFEQTVVKNDPRTVLKRVPSEQPFGRYAMEWRYNLTTGRDDIFHAQFMPGAPISMRVWLKGDGSGNQLFAGVRDWGRRVRGGSNLSRYHQLFLCTLDFTDWREFVVDLPGGGLGVSNDAMGGGYTDYPFELSGFSVRTGGKDLPAAGTIRVGAITLDNQGKSSDAIQVRIAGKTDDGLYRSGQDAALITAHNTHLVHARKARITWSLRDRNGKECAKGQADASIGPVSHHELLAALPEVPAASAPYTLKATVIDAADAAAAASADAVFSIPNAVKTWSFDRRKEYITGFLMSMPVDRLAPMPPKVAGPVVEPASGRKTLPLPWGRGKDASKPSLSAVVIDPALPGHPTKISVDVFGDASGVILYPIFMDRGGDTHDSYQNRILTMTGEARIDFAGWRRLEFRAPLLHDAWDRVENVRRHRPTYPLNLLLATAADSQTKGDSGRLLVDDLRVETQLPPSECLHLAVDADDEAGFLPPGSPVRLRLTNLSLVSPRKVKLEATITPPDGPPLADVRQSVDLAAASDRNSSEKTVELHKSLPHGAYWLAVEADGSTETEPGIACKLHRPLVLMAAGDLGQGTAWPSSFIARRLSRWPEVIVEANKMLAAVGELRELVNLDWDLIEPRPEYFDIGPVAARLRSIRQAGGTTRMFLGFSAHWAAGEGNESRKRNAYYRPGRHIGYTPDYWHVPENIADWDNYIHRLAREVGDLVDVWSFWDNPDVPGLIQLKPDRAIPMLKSVREWTRRYSPNSKVLLSGLNVGSAVGYLKSIHEAGGADLYDIVNIKVNPGVQAPEVWRFREYIQGIQAVAPGKDILISEMDWPVEPEQSGPDAFNAIGQAQNLSRMCLLCHWQGIQQPIVRLSNADDYATGTGLAYRTDLELSGVRLSSEYMVPRPGYLALMTLRRRLAELKPYASVDMDDLHAGNTHAFVYSAVNKGAAVAIWRVEGSGTIEMPDGVKPASAANVYGMPVPMQGRKIAVTPTPVLLSFPEHTPEAVHLALLSAAFWPEETEENEKVMVLRDRVLPAFRPSAGAHGYNAAAAEEPLRVSGIIPGTGAADVVGLAGIKSESFELACPADTPMVLRKRYHLQDKGQVIEVLVNGKKAGTWDLAHARAELLGGLRDAFFIVPKELLAKDGRQKIELNYGDLPGNTFCVWALSLKSDSMPLGQLAPVYAAQADGEMRLDRNVVGDELKVVTKPYRRGIGTHAWSVIEYPLNGQFETFTTLVGIDACSDGRGTVRFEVLGDGQTLSAAAADPKTGKVQEMPAKTAVVNGLADAASLTVNVKGVNRLTLVVHDADDGNKGDAANWLEPVLKRAK